MKTNRLAERRALQIAVAAAVLVPVLAGFAGIAMGLRFVDAAGPVSAASHFSYLSGLLLGIGLAFASLIPRIEDNSENFLMLTLIVATGGFARAWSLLEAGVPDRSMLFGLCMELVVTPALCVWQFRVARQARLTPA